MKHTFTKYNVMVCAFLIGASIVTSCSKDRDEPTSRVYPEENPLALYLKNSGFDQTTKNYINSERIEAGYVFTPKVKGTINAITFMIPANETNVRVTIWDATAKIVLRTIIIPNVIANTEVKKNIDPLAVTPDKNYLISYNGDDYYERKQTNPFDPVNYPIEVGNLMIIEAREGVGTSTAQIYPNGKATNYYKGDVSILFQQTE